MREVMNSKQPKTKESEPNPKRRTRRGGGAQPKGLASATTKPKDRRRRKGRDLEILVALVESTLSSAGAQIRSPEIFQDPETGEPREVDVTIRYTIGSSEVLIALECRDRSRRQGAEWLESLPAKKEAIGADKLIAVSSSGFCRRMDKKAKRLGVELRTLSKIAPDEILRWVVPLPGGISMSVRGLGAELDWDRVEVLDLQIRFDADDEGGGFHPDLVEALRTDPYNTPIFSLGDAPPTVTLNHVLAEFRQRNTPPWLNEPPLAIPGNGTLPRAKTTQRASPPDFLPKENGTQILGARRIGHARLKANSRRELRPQSVRRATPQPRSRGTVARLNT